MNKFFLIILIIFSFFLGFFPHINIHYHPTYFEKELESLIAEGNYFSRIGHKYLKQNPELNTISILSEKVLSHHPWKSFKKTNLKHFIQEKIISDYQESKTILVDQWSLSVTEVQLCALYYLYKKQ